MTGTDPGDGEAGGRGHPAAAGDVTMTSRVLTWLENEARSLLPTKKLAKAGQDKGDADGGGQRVAPGGDAPAQAWTDEVHSLLPPHKPLKPPSCDFSPPIKPKSRFQQRRDKLLDLLTPPYFILCMIAVMVCVGWHDGSTSRLEWAPRAWRREPWRLLTYSVLHASREHLALNALVAVLVSWRLEREQSWWRAALVWCGGAAGGALGAGALQPRTHVVGASAAVYALLTAHLPNVCLRFGHVPLWWFRPLSVVVLGASDLAWWAAGGGAGGSVAWAAHALGALIGFLLGFLVFTGENSGSRHVLACRVTSALLLLTLACAAAVYYGCYDPQRPL